MYRGRRYPVRIAATRTPEDYFEAGLDLLALTGPKAVTVAALCARLGVTKGSFYHHFDGIPDFLRRLLGYWEEQEAALLREGQRRTERERPTELAKLAATWRIRHEAETAIRALGRTDAHAAEVQRRVDQRREDALTGLFTAMGVDKGRAVILARVGIAILIGEEQRSQPVDRRQLEQMLGEYQLWIDHAAGLEVGESW